MKSCSDRYFSNKQPKENIPMKTIYLFLFLALSSSLFAQGPRILIVTAHPDDETMFPVTVFKITRELRKHPMNSIFLS
jgi:hypothetical protein